MRTWRSFASALVLATAIVTLPVRARLEGQDWAQRPVDGDRRRAQDTALASSKELPSMHLLMRPLFTSTSGRPEPTAIHVTMNLTSPSKRFTPDQPLLTLPLKIVTVPTARYDDDANPIVATNAQGDALRLSYKDEDPEVGPRLWYLDKGQPDPDTGVVLKFTAPYRVTNKTTRAGPRVELRRDVSGGGLVGQGIGFLPVPPPVRGHGDAQFSSRGMEGGQGWDEVWNVTLKWDLSESPPGTHGAWSLGDEQEVTASGTLDELISQGIFAVGYLRRYPDWSVDLSSTSPSTSNVYATYWLEPSPYNMTQLARQTKKMYGRIANYFNSTDPFRVFIRRIEDTWGGTGAKLSFLLEYSEHSAEYSSALGMADLLAHEAVHEFALLDLDASDPEYQEDENTWYIEGGASWVGDLVGLNGADEASRAGMVQSLNNNAQAYYTAPLWTLEMDFGEVLRRYWDEYDIVRVSYYRGFVFLALLDGLIWRATEGKMSMDDVIVDLYKIRREGRCTLGDLKNMVAGLIGWEAMEEAYTTFFRGELIVPPENGLERYGLKLVKQPWHRFELGIDSVSLREFRVRGLMKGTNADKAGVQDGDVIVRGHMVWTVQDDLHGKMRLTVLRDGHELDLEWWPRSDEVVEAYGWVDLRAPKSPDEL